MTLSLTAAADPGESAAWALVESRPNARPLLRLLVEVHGARWNDLAFDGARQIVAMAGGPVPCAIEVPHATVHRGAGMAHHASGTGLGRRIGRLEAAWFAASGEWPAEVLPGSAEGQWWRPFRLGKKREMPGRPLGWHRVAEASMFVEGAAARLALVGSAARRVDCAEAVLMAAAVGLSGGAA